MRKMLVALGVCVPIILACGGGGGGGGGGSTASAEEYNLAFSNWKVEWVGGGIVNEFDFLADGTFVDPKHPSNVNTYTVTGNKIHMEYNDSFVIYDGEFVNSTTMGGTYKTKKGKEGPWRGRKLLD